MNSNLRKDLVDSVWEQLWEKNLDQYLVGEQTGPPYCPPEKPCVCEDGGQGEGGGNGGGSGGGDGDSNAKDFYENNPGLTDAANQKAKDIFDNNKKQTGSGKGPLDPSRGNNVKGNYNSQGQQISSGGGEYEPGNNYSAGLEFGSNRYTSGAVGGYVKYSNGSWSADYELDPKEILDAAARAARKAAEEDRKKDCNASEGSGENPDDQDGPKDKTDSKGGDGTSNNPVRPVTGGSTALQGNSALGRLPVPKSSGTGGGVKK
jgi:hypothetical protein